MYHYNDLRYEQVAEEMRCQGSARSLVKTLSHEELLNHVSTVFYCDTLAVAVGEELPAVQAVMRRTGIHSIAGLTPKFPIFNPDANDVANSVYVRYFSYKLTQKGVTYIPCCFLLPNITPSEVMELLKEDGEPSQLSFIYLPLGGKGQLISCIETALA